MAKDSKVEFLTENFNATYWNTVLYYAIMDTNFLKKIRRLVPIECFRNKASKILVREVYSYYDIYKQAPEQHFYELFQDLEKTLSDKDYENCMNIIGILKNLSGKNSQYILDKITQATKHFRLEESAVEFASLIKRKKYDEAKAVILKAMKSTEEEEESEYYDYFDDKTYIEERLKENKIKMKSLIEPIDKMIGGFDTPWLITILGATKGGKSWWLGEMVVAAAFQGLNVIYISLEMSKKIIDSRLDQIVGFMSSKETNEPLEIMKFKRDSWVKSQEVVNSIYDISAVEKNRRRLRKIGGGKIKVMAFNRGRLNYLDIERVLDELEEKDGFIADVLVVDYLGIMRETAAGQAVKERIGENCLGIKEMCGKRNLIGFTAMQGNRKAMTAKVFHSHLISSDIDVVFNSDLILAICQTKREEEENKYRIYCANSRHGKQHWSVGLVRDLETGQIAIGEYSLKESDTSEDEEKESNGSYY